MTKMLNVHGAFDALLESKGASLAFYQPFFEIVARVTDIGRQIDINTNRAEGEMADLADVANLLEDLVAEVRGLRLEFQEFTSFGVQDMRTTVSDITGPTGYHLEDVHGKLSEMANSLAMIEIKTSL